MKLALLQEIVKQHAQILDLQRRAFETCGMFSLVIKSPAGVPPELGVPGPAADEGCPSILSIDADSSIEHLTPPEWMAKSQATQDAILALHAEIMRALANPE